VGNPTAEWATDPVQLSSSNSAGSEECSKLLCHRQLTMHGKQDNSAKPRQKGKNIHQTALVTGQKQAEGLGRQGSLVHVSAQRLRHAGRREVLWERGTHRSFPGFFTSAVEALTLLCCAPAFSPPNGNGKNQIEQPGHFLFPKSSPRPVFEYVN